MKQLNPELLLHAMQGELDAISFYQQLMKMTSDQQDISLITDIHNDEVKHFKLFHNLYRQLYGVDAPTIRPREPNIVSFREGVKQAILDELESYELYYEIYLSSTNPTVRNIFFEAMADENEHAAKFNFMYTKSLEAMLKPHS